MNLQRDTDDVAKTINNKGEMKRERNFGMRCFKANYL